MKVLAIAQRMLYSLDNPKSSELAVMYLEDLKALRSTDEEWDAFKKESTVEEFATIELISEIFACRDDVLHRGKADLDGLADNLKNNIPLPGLDSHDVNWEILHAAWLTILVWILLFCSDFRYVNMCFGSRLRVHPKRRRHWRRELRKSPTLRMKHFTPASRRSKSRRISAAPDQKAIHCKDSQTI